MNDLIRRQAAIDVARKCPVKEVTPVYMLCDKAEVMTELMMLPSAQQEQQWIPCGERLPFYGQDVLAVRAYGDGEKYREVLIAHIAVWNESTNEKWWNATNITHWMPLPEPPKEVKV